MPVRLERGIFLQKNKYNKYQSYELKKGYLITGHTVSEYHYISQVPVIIYHTRGKSDVSEMLLGGLFFVGNPSGFFSIKNKVDINATKT